MNLKDMKELTKEQIKELEMLATEIEAEAIQMKLDYETSGSEHSGSIVFINENSPLLDDENIQLGNTMAVTSTQRLKKKLEENDD